MVKLETNIDDMNPELYEYVSQQLFDAGAADVWMTPIHAKKGRPGILLSVTTDTIYEEALSRILLRETTTLGIRVCPILRKHKAQWELRSLHTEYGPVTIKIKWFNDEFLGLKPEYEECKRLAQRHHVPLRVLCESIKTLAYQTFDFVYHIEQEESQCCPTLPRH